MLFTLIVVLPFYIAYFIVENIRFGKCNAGLNEVKIRETALRLRAKDLSYLDLSSKSRCH
jgi:hypothetical protein